MFYKCLKYVIQSKACSLLWAADSSVLSVDIRPVLWPMGDAGLMAAPALLCSEMGSLSAGIGDTGHPASKAPCVCVCVCVLAAQSCLIFCDTMVCSPPGSSVHGILQARTLE